MQEDKDTAVQQPEMQEQNAQPTELDFFKTYASQIIIGILIVAATGIAAQKYFKNADKSRQAAADKLFSAKNIQDLEILASGKHSSPVTPLAILKLAKAHFNSGNFDMALAKYNDFRTKHPKHELLDAAELGRLHCLEARNQVDEALAGFTTFVAAKTNHFLYAEAVIGKARCLEQLGKQKEAVTVYEDFITANPDSPWSSKIDDLMTALKKKTGDKKSSG